MKHTTELFDGTIQTTMDISFTYEQSGEIYIGTGTDKNNPKYTCQVSYDKKGNLLSQNIVVNGEEQSRLEITYDDHGNIIKSEEYAKGQLAVTTETSYKAVEVSADFANRFTQFRKEN